MNIIFNFSRRKREVRALERIADALEEIQRQMAPDTISLDTSIEFTEFHDHLKDREEPKVVDEENEKMPESSRM